MTIGNKVELKTNIIPGEITAYRVWRVDKQGWLYSVIRETCSWYPGEPLRKLNTTPGIHAFKSIEDAIREYGCFNNTVIGEVLLWGQVTEHELGYTAEYAQPKSLIGTTHLGDIWRMKAALKLYNIPKGDNPPERTTVWQRFKRMPTARKWLQALWPPQILLNAYTCYSSFMDGSIWFSGMILTGFLFCCFMFWMPLRRTRPLYSNI